MSSNIATRRDMSSTSFTAEDADHERLVAQLTATPAPRLAFLDTTDAEHGTHLLEIVDDPTVRNHFADRCVFLSCDSTTSTEVTIICLASALGLEPSEDAMGAIYDNLIAHDRTLIVLEHLDAIYSPTDPEQREATDVMLATLASADELTLVISLRGEPPDCVVWTRLNDATADVRQCEPQAAPSSLLPEHTMITPVVSPGLVLTAPCNQPPSVCETSHAVVRSDILSQIPTVPVATNIDNITDAHHEPTSHQTSYRPVTIAQSKLLPARPAVFHGRDKELERLVVYTISSSTAPIGIVGPGGIGKTTLAMKVMHERRVKQHFGKERFFLTCDGANSVDEVLGHLAGKLDVQRPQNAPLWPAVIDNLRSRRRVLLLLDNFESLWSPTNEELREAAEVFLAQLSVIDELTLLVTTRGNLLPESFAWANSDTAELDTLSSAAARRTFNDLTCLKPSILAAEPEETALTKLLREVDFMPLAIVLLARLDDLPSRLLREWLEHYTAVLEADRHDGTRRELSVEVSIKISLAHLPAESSDLRPRELLSVMGQLPAGLFPNISNQLHATIPNLDRAAQDLLRHSLVYTGGLGELKMLSPVRHHVSAHLHMPIATLSAVDKIYQNIVDAQPTFERLDIDGPAYDVEFPNIQSVLTAALDRRSDAILVRAILRIAKYAAKRGQHCLQLLQKLLLRIGDVDASRGDQADLNQNIANQYLLAGDLHQCAKFHARAADLYADLDNKRLEAVSRSILGVSLKMMGQHEDGDRQTARAELLARDVPDLWYLATVAPGENTMLVEQRFRDVREFHIKTGDGHIVSQLTFQIEKLLNERGDSVAHAKELELSLSLAEQMLPGSLWHAMAYLELANEYIKNRNLDGAEDLLIVAYAMMSQLNNKLGLAEVILKLAAVHERRRRFSEAAEILEAASRLFQECGSLDDVKSCDQMLNDLRKRIATHQ